MRHARYRAVAGFVLALAICTSVRAADIKIAGKLAAPANASVIAICTDPVLQSVLNEDLRAARRGQPSNPDTTVTLTVTVNQQMLAPGITLNQMFPGDPSMVELLKE